MARWRRTRSLPLPGGDVSRPRSPGQERCPVAQALFEVGLGPVDPVGQFRCDGPGVVLVAGRYPVPGGQDGGWATLHVALSIALGGAQVVNDRAARAEAGLVQREDQPETADGVVRQVASVTTQSVQGCRQVSRRQRDAHPGATAKERRRAGPASAARRPRRGRPRRGLGVDGEQRAGQVGPLTGTGRADDDHGHTTLHEQPRERGQARLEYAGPEQREHARWWHPDSIGQAAERGLTAVLR